LHYVKKSKSAFACTHADCLSWNIYSPKEKKELLVELQKMSPDIKSRLAAWAYLNGFGKLISLPNKLTFFFKKWVKQLAA